MVLQLTPEACERIVPRTLHQRQQHLASSCQNCGSHCNGHPGLVPSRRELVGVEHGSRTRVETERDLPFYFSQDSSHWQDVHGPHSMRSHRSDLVMSCQRPASSVVCPQCPSVAMVGSRQTGLGQSRHRCPSPSLQQLRRTELEDVGLELRMMADWCSMPRPTPANEIGQELELDKSPNEQMERNQEEMRGVTALHDGKLLSYKNAGRELRRLADEICSEIWLSSVGGDLDLEDSCCILGREMGRELG